MRGSSRTLVGVGCAIVVAFSVLLSVFGLIALNGATSIAREIALAKDIEINLLMARRAEKDFLLRSLTDPAFFETGKSKYLTKFESAVSLVQDETQELLGSRPAIAEKINRHVVRYRLNFYRLVEELRARGYKSWGLEGAWRQSAHGLEQALTGKDPAALSTLLQARRAEKDFLLRGEPKYIERFESLITQLRGEVPESLFDLLSDYRKGVMAYVAAGRAIGTTADEGLRGQTRAAAHAIMPLTLEAVRVSEERGAARERQVFWTGFGVLLVGTLGVVITLLLLGRSVSRAEKAREKERARSQVRADLADALGGKRTEKEIADAVLPFLAERLSAQVGTFCVANEEDTGFSLLASYALTRRKRMENEFALGEGLIGQAALERSPIVVTDVAKDYVPVSSSVGTAAPAELVVFPLLREDAVDGVIELGSTTAFGEDVVETLREVGESIALTLHGVRASEATAQLLKKTQEQQEELRANNEELESQARSLESSESELRAQEEELRASNEALGEKTKALQKTSDDYKAKNAALEEAHKELEEQKQALAVSGKYKSEFLANMSHELRTPLNSLILLTGMLKENREGNLTEDQVKSADTILGAANDLLALINEVLDLSKIESGHMEATAVAVSVPELELRLKKMFVPLAQEKGLTLDIASSTEAPKTLGTDQKRLEQILKNLLSNAIKFTEAGRVSLTISRPPPCPALSAAGLEPSSSLLFEVQDTGVGVSDEDKARIFEAFQQADGSTSRPQGGTGLGLSISKELAKLLGGTLTLESEPGRGSKFMLVIPSRELGAVSGGAGETGGPPPSPPVAHQANGRAKADTAASSPGRSPQPAEAWVPDDRESLSKERRSLLVVEDDRRFAELVRDYARRSGFDVLLAPDGETGLRMAEEYLPSGILLDIKLPGIDGMEVLAQLKDRPSLRHIPVHVASGAELDVVPEHRGAIGTLMKPATADEFSKVFEALERSSEGPRTLLVIEDDDTERQAVMDLLDGKDITVLGAASAEEGLKVLRTKKVGCVVVDLGLSGMTGFQCLEAMQGDPELARVPAIIHTGRELTKSERERLGNLADTVIVKSERSAERLVDEAALFLHRIDEEMPEQQRRIIRMLHDSDAALKGSKLLLVDDDMRNSFALRKLLNSRGAEVVLAENGLQALKKLEAEEGIDLVLMDIMMPVMDGFEATRRIRQNPKFKKLPVIALTAKAMPEDREACMAAEASDFLTKPVDVDRLLSVLRIWLHK